MISSVGKSHLCGRSMTAYIILSTLIIGALSGYFIFSAQRAKEEKTKLKNSLDKVIGENEIIREQYNALQKDLDENKKKLSGLRNAQALKAALSSAQSAIESMNNNLESLRSEKLALQQENISLSSRLTNTGRELSKIFDELKRAKEELAGLDRSKVIPLKMKLEELDKIQSEYNRLLEENKLLQARLSGLERDKSGAGTSMQPLLDNINKLNMELADKQNRIKTLESQISRKSKDESVEAGRDGVSKDNRQQMSRLSEIIANKELDLDKTRKELKEAGERIAGLQSKIAHLEKSLSDSQVDREKLKNIEMERVTFQRQIKEMEVEAKKKSELADSMQKNLNYLNEQLVRKDEEKKQLELKVSRLAETEGLYNSMRVQVLQLSEYINAKDRELEQRRRDIDLLKDEISTLKAQSVVLDKELSETRDRQKKTIDDLSVTLKLNSALQEKIAFGQDIDSRENLKEKEKTDELKRKIEVILSTPSR
ncbi:MAG: hypothetical protein ABIG46_08990 [Candidatus Omnitrophota bacterium]|nr:hypothetical protein [Candidatus Omnitrophota bacterium]